MMFITWETLGASRRLSMMARLASNVWQKPWLAHTSGVGKTDHIVLQTPEVLQQDGAAKVIHGNIKEP
jgi:hypothetical protein